MATQPSDKQGSSHHAEPAADVHVRIGSGPSHSRGAPGISKNVVDQHRYRPLLQAAFKGDWKSAKQIFDHDSASMTAIITPRSETVLHVAALCAQDQFFENLVKLFSPYPEMLEMVDCDGRTALHNAVLCGRIKMVKALVTKNSRLTQLRDKDGRVPFQISAREASMHKKIAWYLAKNITEGDRPRHPFNSPEAILSIIDLTYAGHHDIVLYLVGRYPDLILLKGPNESDNTILGVLARMQSHFLSRTWLIVWQRLIYKCIPVDVHYRSTDNNSRNMQTSIDMALQCLTRSLSNAANIVVPRMHEVKLRHVAAVELAKQVCIALSQKNSTEITQFLQDGDPLAQATVKGITALVRVCIQFFPELIWISPQAIPQESQERTHRTTLRTLAVKYRQERILAFFLKVSSTRGLSFAQAGSTRELLSFAPADSTNELAFAPAPTHDEMKDMMLAVTEYNPDFATAEVFGAALQMQRELQWFKAVESWVTPDLRTAMPNESAYWEMFVEAHKELLQNGQKWVKRTASSCMLVSTLIASVLFTAGVSVLGRYAGSADPSRSGKYLFLLFAIPDAVGLFSSMMAILLFLSILTSQYEPLDFLDSLPKKIIIGFSLLFLSVTCMGIAFAAPLAFVLGLDGTPVWVSISVYTVAGLPLLLFEVLQLPLLSQMFFSTYGRSIFSSEDVWK